MTEWRPVVVCDSKEQAVIVRQIYEGRDISVVCGFVVGAPRVTVSVAPQDETEALEILRDVIQAIPKDAWASTFEETQANLEALFCGECEECQEGIWCQEVPCLEG